MAAAQGADRSDLLRLPPAARVEVAAIHILINSARSGPPGRALFAFRRQAESAYASRMARYREPKLPLSYFIDDGCLAFEVWCTSGQCTSVGPRLVMMADILKAPGVTHSTRLDEIEGRLRCLDCKVKGAADARPASEWSYRGPGN